MPIYEYKCEDCGKVNEVFQKGPRSEESIICSYCGSPRLKKMFSVPGAIIVSDSPSKGTTCCGREERCDTPPCSTDGVCRRD